jgi:hypothetical protein
MLCHWLYGTCVHTRFVILWNTHSLWKNKWFAISLATRFLNYNDHLQLHFNSMYFYNMNYIGQVAWVVANATNYICMQFFSCHYVGTTIVQLQFNHFAIAIEWHVDIVFHPSINDEFYWFPLQFLCNYGCSGHMLMTTTNWQLCDIHVNNNFEIKYCFGNYDAIIGFAVVASKL